MNIEGKKISIIGAERSGIAAAKLALKLGAIPFVSDSGSKEKLEKSITQLESNNINFEINHHTEKVFDCDFIVTSPGVPTDSDVLKTANQKGIKIYSEVEFASWFIKGKIIAITGTNGKTTTTALIEHTLNSAGIKCYSAGNIGKPLSDLPFTLKEDEFVSLETSSFQIDYIDRFKPLISMILNITPDHLDRYNNNFDEYIASKIKITRNQNEQDYFIYNNDDANTFKTLNNVNVNRMGFSVKSELVNGAYLKEEHLYFSKDSKIQKICSVKDLFIKGEHNIANALAVVATAKILDIPNKKIEEAFRSFKGVEHRIEFVKEINGVEYYNDSKGTNVDSVRQAFPNVLLQVFFFLLLLLLPDYLYLLPMNKQVHLLLSSFLVNDLRKFLYLNFPTDQ